MIACDGYESALCPARRHVEQAELERDEAVGELAQCRPAYRAMQARVERAEAAQAVMVEALRKYTRDDNWGKDYWDWNGVERGPVLAQEALANLDPAVERRIRILEAAGPVAAVLAGKVRCADRLADEAIRLFVEAVGKKGETDAP